MKSVAVILLIALLAQSNGSFFIQLNYEINKAYIASNLCVNRAKPSNCCQGKCYLKKQLAKTSSESNAAGQKNANAKNNLLFFDGVKAFIHSFAYAGIIKSYTIRQQSFSDQGHISNIFHPPGTEFV